MQMMAIINQKGGVGKTTTTINLAHAFALSGKRILVLDLDPQAHLSAGLGSVDPDTPGMDQVLLHGISITDVVIRSRHNLDLVVAGDTLANMEQLKDGGVDRGRRLQAALRECSESYDAVMFDCPPSAGLLGMNALFAATKLLIPVSSDYLSLHGLSRFMVTLQFVETTLQRSLRRQMVMTRFHTKRRLAREVREKLEEYFPGQLLKTAIRENVALAESPSYGETIFEYQRSSNGATDYSLLAHELMSKGWH